MIFKKIKGDKRVEIEIYKCSECGCQELLYFEEKGDTVCSNCGLVLAEKREVNPSEGLKPGAFQEFYGPGQKLWSHSQKKGSIFGFSKGFRDIKRKYLAPEIKTKFGRLRKLHTSRGKKNIDIALATFRNMTSAINTPPSVREEAARIFLKSLRKKLTAGRSYEAIIGAAIFIAYAINRYTKSITKLSKEILTPQREIFKCYQLLVRELEIKVNINLRAEDFVSQFCSELHTGIEIEQKARKMIKEFQEKVNTSGKDPKGIAVGAIYLASERKHRSNPKKYRKITQKELSSTGSVTEVTLRIRYREIEKTVSIT